MRACCQRDCEYAANEEKQYDEASSHEWQGSVFAEVDGHRAVVVKPRGHSMNGLLLAFSDAARTRSVRVHRTPEEEPVMISAHVKNRSSVTRPALWTMPC